MNVLCKLFKVFQISFFCLVLQPYLVGQAHASAVTFNCTYLTGGNGIEETASIFKFDLNTQRVEIFNLDKTPLFVFRPHTSEDMLDPDDVSIVSKTDWFGSKFRITAFATISKVPNMIMLSPEKNYYQLRWTYFLTNDAIDMRFRCMEVVPR